MRGSETIGGSRIWSTTVIDNAEHLANPIEAVLVDHGDLEGLVEFLTWWTLTWGQQSTDGPKGTLVRWPI